MTGGLLGRAAAHEPRADAAARLRAAGRGRQPRELPAGGGDRDRPLPRARDHVRRAVPVPRLGRLQVARGRGLGARAGVGRRRSPRWPTRRSTSSPRRSETTATSTRSSRSWRPGASTATSSSATSCTASATSSRRRSPGTGRSATTGCWPWPGAPPTRVDAALGPGGADGIDGHPEIEMALVELYRVDRRGPLPRARRASTSTDAATAGWGRGGSAARTGRTWSRSGRRAASRDTRCASCTSTRCDRRRRRDR